jgi:putative tricarboxylic transport membrane protein
MLENNLRKSMILEGGSLTVFLNRPISAVCLLVALALLLAPLLPKLRKQREAIALDEAS